MAGILLIEDSRIMREMTKAMLEKIGHEVVGEAENGVEGYDKYFALKPDIAIIDITMPILDGITALKKILEKDENAKIILLTSNTKKEKIKDAADAGVAGILFKPINEDQLEEAINQILHGNKPAG